MWRRVLGVIAGIVAGAVIVTCIEFLGHALFPPPPGTNVLDPEQMKQMISRLPLGALAFVVIGWALGALGAGWVAAKISRDVRIALAVGFIMTLAGVMTMLEIPHPIWMWACGLLIPVPLAWLGAKYAGVAAPAEARA